MLWLKADSANCIRLSNVCTTRITKRWVNEAYRFFKKGYNISCLEKVVPLNTHGLTDFHDKCKDGDVGPTTNQKEASIVRVKK